MLRNGEAKTHTSEDILVAGAGIPCRSLKGAFCDSEEAIWEAWPLHDGQWGLGNSIRALSALSLSSIGK